MGRILGVILVLVLLLGIAVIIWPEKFKLGSNDEEKACTQEAMQCPDGSYVGRSGPNCEFDPCPSPTASATPTDTSWQLYTDSNTNITFEYQPRLETTYVIAHEWPPRIELMKGSFSCKRGQVRDKANQIVISELHTVNGRQYCVAVTTEGAAGSIYKDYLYTTSREGRLVYINFTLRYPQCVNYEEPQRNQCEQEQQFFNLDALVDRIATSIRFL